MVDRLREGVFCLSFSTPGSASVRCSCIGTDRRNETIERSLHQQNLLDKSIAVRHQMQTEVTQLLRLLTVRNTAEVHNNGQ